MRERGTTYDRRIDEEETPYYGEESREPRGRSGYPREGERYGQEGIRRPGSRPSYDERGRAIQGEPARYDERPSREERFEREGYGRRSEPEGYGRRFEPEGYGRASRRSTEWTDYNEHPRSRERERDEGLGQFIGRGPRNFRRSDERIYDDVGERFTQDPWLDASDIQVDVRGAAVTLSGTVEDREAKRRAEDIAESVVGVTDVRNELRVRGRGGESWRTTAMRGGAAGASTAATQPRQRGDVGEQETVVGVFRDIGTADRAINELKSLGFTREDISFLTKDRGFQTESATGTTGAETKGATTGAVLGGLGGGAIGWLLGVGALAIPGVGPIVAAGALATTIAGAAAGALAGGLVGALVGVGIPENEAKDYERLVKEGGVLVAVTCQTDEEKDSAKDVLRRFNAEKVKDFRGDRRDLTTTPRGNGQRREAVSR